MMDEKPDSVQRGADSGQVIRFADYEWASMKGSVAEKVEQLLDERVVLRQKWKRQARELAAAKERIRLLEGIVAEGRARYCSEYDAQLAAAQAEIETWKKVDKVNNQEIKKLRAALDQKGSD